MPSRFVPLYYICVATVILAASSRFTFAHFWPDDFNNLWLAQTRGARLAADLINPASAEFRPAGLLLYWALWHGFHLHPLPYHVAAWTIHAVNVYLVYLLLTELVGSRYAAAWGALAFAFEAVYLDIFYNFSVIFELWTALFFFLGLLAFLRMRDGWKKIAVLLALYLLAFKAKEMAVTLPAVFLWYELAGRKPREAGDAGGKGRELLNQALKAGQWLLPMALLGAWLLHAFLPSADTTDASAPYHLVFSAGPLADSCRWYFDALFGLPFCRRQWLITAFVLTGLAALLLRREWRVLFFGGYILITFLPVIFIPNHRFGFYWYIPFLGICGLAALLIHPLARLGRSTLPPRAGAILGCVLFGLASWGQFRYQAYKSRFAIEWARNGSAELRGFTEALQALPPPDPDETVYYQAVPDFQSIQTLTSETRVVFGRMDLEVQVAPEFPPESRYRLRLENTKLVLERAARSPKQAD